MLDVHRLTLLREVDLRGSVSAAARALSYSPSAVSQQLSLLEREVGTTLLERVGRGIRLTPAAKRLVQHAEIVIAALERAEADVTGSLETIHGEVRIAAFSTLARTVLPEVLVDLGNRHSELTVHFRQQEPDEALADLASGLNDLALIDVFPGETRDIARFHTTVMAEDPIAAYVPSWIDGSSLVELARVPWIMEDRGTHSHLWARQLCTDAGFQPIVRFESFDLFFHRRLVEADVAAAFLPALVVQTSTRPLAQSSAFPTGLSRSLLAVIRSGSERTRAVVACRDALVRALRNRLGEPSPRSLSPGE